MAVRMLILQGHAVHWDVNNEMLHGNYFIETTHDPNIRVKMFKWAQEADPASLKFVNDFDVLMGKTER